MQRCCIVNKYWSEVKVWKRCQNGTTGWNPDRKSYQNVINKESGSAVHVCGLVFYLQCWRVMRICHRSYCFARHSVYIVPLCYMIWHSSELIDLEYICPLRLVWECVLFVSLPLITAVVKEPGPDQRRVLVCRVWRRIHQTHSTLCQHSRR